MLHGEKSPKSFPFERAIGPKLIMFLSPSVINQPNDKQNLFIDLLLSLWAHAYERYTNIVIDFLTE